MYQRILVPIDGSPTSNQGLTEAVKLAKLTGARLRLLHVINELTFTTGFEIYTAEVFDILKEGGTQILAEAKAHVDAAGVEAVTQLYENFGSRLCDVVVNDAIGWKADLIVIGSHGRRGIGRLFIGSDAEQILRSSPVPVLLVHSPAPAQGVVPAAGKGTAEVVPSAVPA
jgi:nucleotide-binding universal stress UspA family protein